MRSQDTNQFEYWKVGQGPAVQVSDAADKEGLGGLDSAIANLTRYEQRVSKCVLIDECGHVTKVKTILPRVIFKDQT